MSYMCERKYGVKVFGAIHFDYEDMGELNVEITELCDSIKKTLKPDDDRFEFSIAMEKTSLARDLKDIFKDYNLNFKEFMMYDDFKVSYSQYASKHTLLKEHHTPHVYLVNRALVILRKKN
jgi:hypothetical protein